MSKKRWTDEEKKQLEEYYKKGLKFDEISKLMDRSISSLNSMSCDLKFGNTYPRYNNPKFKAIYQNYDWCYERFINRDMTHAQIAEECGASLRVIKKWCVEKFDLNCHTWRKHKKLTKIQKELIMFSLLGDGHIDKRETQPLFIVSHAENQKDYLYWKYDILKDLCSSEPSYYEEAYHSFGTNKEYLCQPHYRCGTRIVDALYEIREMESVEIINHLNEFGLSIYMLDDGYRGSSNWELCVADYNIEEKDLLIKIMKSRFNLNAKMLKDNRYIGFDAVSSRCIDGIILDNIPNDLDIIKHKILENHICKEADYTYVITNNDKLVGLNTYCRNNKYIYDKCKNITNTQFISKIKEEDFKLLMKGCECRAI